MTIGRARAAFIALAIAISTFVAAPAGAAPIEEKNLLKGKETIEQDQGYIFLHSRERQIGWLLREPTQEDIDKFKADWEKAYAKALERYERDAADYEKDVEYAKQKRFKIPDRPIKPERESFSIGQIESRMGLGFGPQFVYSKGEGYFSYLTAVEPGTYTYYGPITFNPDNGFVGICECMGSIKFEVKPGVITNLGDMLALAWATPEQLKQSSVFNVQVQAGTGYFGLPWAAETKVKQTDGSAIDGRETAPVNYDLPESLASYPNQRADFRAAGKMNNFMGIRIGRFPPVPGVLAYERDKVIDLVAKAEMEAAAAAAEEAARAERDRLAAEQAEAVTAHEAETEPSTAQ